MEIGIAGPPASGKTTVFNALTRSHAQTGGGQRDPHRAVVKVPDPRVDALTEIFHPKSIKYADVEFVDVAGLAKGSGAESEAAILGHLRTVDALLIVVPAFGFDANLDSFLAELVSIGEDFVLADMAIVERRQERLEREVRMGAGTPAERQLKEAELGVLRRVGAVLDEGQPVSALALTTDDLAHIRNFGLLTVKPAIAIANIGDDVAAGERLVAAAHGHLPAFAREALAIPGRLEMELAELDSDEAQEFMTAMGLRELHAREVIQASYRLLDLLSFLTAGEDEVRAWPIRRGATALDAAATIHSDLARGFIRAEVVAYNDFIDAGSTAEARKRGKLRSEGKTYVVQDGDIANILFNI